MKKSILLIASFVFFALAGQSQSFSLSNADGPIDDGGHIYVMSDDPDVADIVSHVYVTNNSATTKNVKVYRTKISMVEGSWEQFCWFVCFAPGVDTSATDIPIAPGMTNEGDFSGHYWPVGNTGESVISYTFYDKNNMNDKVTVNVHYKLSLTGIEDLLAENTSFSAPYPNPATQFVSFDYDVPADVNKAEIVISNLLGAEVMRSALVGNTGTARINVSDLSEGIYFATVKLNNLAVKTQKLVVK